MEIQLGKFLELLNIENATDQFDGEEFGSHKLEQNSANRTYC